MEKIKRFPWYGTLLLRMGGLMLLYSLARLVFFLLNKAYFTVVDPLVFFYGMRFDVVALCYLNALYALLLMMPGKIFSNKKYRLATDIVFGVTNTAGLLVSCIDMAYFPFSLRRATIALFQFVGVTNNMETLIPQFAHDFWMVILVFLLFLSGLWLLIRLVNYDLKSTAACGKWEVVKMSASRLAMIFLFVMGCRGGLQLRPINVVSAGAYTSVENIPLVLNTPFTMINSVGKTTMQKVDFFQNEQELETCFSPIKSKAVNNLTPMPSFDNVVVIILEGISSEFSDYLAHEPKAVAGFTPFIDSIARQSVVFQGRANGQQSIVSLAAVLGSIPTLSEQPFTQSHYATNRIHYPLAVLKEAGWHTSFFHGGANGTMGFDKFCDLTGVENYYGLDEYPDAKKDYDGHWGIFDEPYLQYVAQTLKTEKTPFFTCIYTLSSHHPFVVPQPYANVLPKGEFPMLQTVAYTDMALQKFFTAIADAPWFNRTLFVITSDHTDFAGSPHNHNDQLYNVPMIFYHPKNRHPLNSPMIVQQIDIMPSVMALLGNEKTFTAFGNNAFDTTQAHVAISFKTPYYQMETASGKYDFDGRQSWRFSADSLAGNEKEKNYLKAFIQQYVNRMISNQLYE